MTQPTQHIRNFSIIAHIDHGKSTLADRFLEVTHTIEARKMKEQVLDSMDLERERGITIKMQPARMKYDHEGVEYVLNLIDTPGHIDFAYEVSRALKAVEGAILLVDSTQGVQAQTLTTLSMAEEQGLVIIPVLSKIDSPNARIDDVKLEVAEILGCDLDDVLGVSGKTGEGVQELLKRVIEKVPPPKPAETDEERALVFDFQYSNHRGIIVYARVFGGSVVPNAKYAFAAARKAFGANEVGIFAPSEVPTESLSDGEIGYIVTGIKEPGIVSVGDTIIKAGSVVKPLSGYEHPRPVIWASLFPESQDDFVTLRQSLEQLKLSDSSLTFEQEASGILGRGFRCGFLGMLHLEIVTERLKREFDLQLTVTSPSIEYKVHMKDGTEEIIYTASQFPEFGEIKTIYEQRIQAKIIARQDHVDVLMQVFYEYEALVLETEVFGDGRARFILDMPLRELMRGFFDDLKRVSSGYASLSYERLDGWHEAEVVKLDILVAEERVPAFARIVSERRVEEEAKKIVEKLYELLPRQLHKTKLQAEAKGRIIASKTLSALRKDVTGYLYGGDVTRKKKLLEKQKKGKKRRAQYHNVDIPQDVFIEMVKTT